MPLHAKLASFCVFFIFPACAATFTYQVVGEDPGAWPQILSSVGLTPAAGQPAYLSVVRTVSPDSVPQWLDKIEQGGVVVIEGDNKLGQVLGFQAGEKHVTVRSIIDQRAPKLPIIWENALDIPVFELPHGAQVLAFERWERAPVMASLRRGSGAVLWIASSPGKLG
jgi:hypothetical protein